MICLRSNFLAIFFGLSFLLACERPLQKGEVNGEKIFKTACARCHGENGVPDRAVVARIGVKPLNTLRVANELSDEDIRQQVLKGSANKQMPSFASALSEAQIKSVIAHVRSLQNVSK